MASCKSLSSQWLKSYKNLWIPLTVRLRVAKLARLMPGLPEFIEPLSLAETKECVSGVLQVNKMLQLSELLSDNSGTVSFRLEFDFNEHRTACVAGEYQADLHVVCQRCLETFTLHLRNNINIGFVAGQSAGEKLTSGVETIPLSGERISLLGLIQEEVMLGMPIAPVHDDVDCSIKEYANKTGVVNPNPFSVLKELKLKKGQSEEK